MREIAGYICMNAYFEDTLKMQKITAWFALSLPVSSGPERFGGLPGLILEVDINKGALLITAESVNLKPVNEELKKPTFKRITTISEEKYRMLLQQHFDKKRKDEEPPFTGIRY
jgi:GLPGLI family protein